jgi:HEPN domain-containing protein
MRIDNIDDFVIRSFRDLADEDYISARMSFRAALVTPSLWSSHQMVEKYIKCILLLNRIPAKNMWHELNGLKAIED